jgi:hypothetical protein
MDSRIEQCLMNLIINANDAIGRRSGVILVETRLLQLDRDYLDRSFSLEAGSFAVLEVSDNGCGIDSKDFERIFEPFFTTKPRGIGTGLGLSSVFTLMKEWKGVVAVASRPGLGTTFKLVFPLASCDSALPSPQQPLQGQSWVLNDADAARQLTLRRDLSALGGEVVKAPSQEGSATLSPLGRPLTGLQICDLSPRLAEHLGLLPQDCQALGTPFARHELAAKLELFRSP